MKTVIEQVLVGAIDIDDFLDRIQSDNNLQAYVWGLIPEAAKDDPSHSFWKVVPYDTMRRNNFDYYQFLFWSLQPNDKYGNQLTIFSRLQRAYLYYYPDVICTSKYNDAFDLYLDVARDCFDGPEVLHIIEHVIDESLQFKSKSQRIKHGQTAIKGLFHVENKKRPRWIQGAEWPMGQNAPMKFISQERSGEKVQYVFSDVDTGEIRIVEQFS